MGCVLESRFFVEGVVVCGFRAADAARRASTLSGDVLLSRERCKGEKKWWISR